VESGTIACISRACSTGVYDRRVGIPLVVVGDGHSIDGNHRTPRSPFDASMLLRRICPCNS
jgi:hypothetical protein